MAGLLAFILPETIGRQLPDTVNLYIILLLKFMNWIYYNLLHVLRQVEEAERIGAKNSDLTDITDIRLTNSTQNQQQSNNNL